MGSLCISAFPIHFSLPTNQCRFQHDMFMAGLELQKLPRIGFGFAARIGKERGRKPPFPCGNTCFLPNMSDIGKSQALFARPAFFPNEFECESGVIATATYQTEH